VALTRSRLITPSTVLVFTIVGVGRNMVRTCRGGVSEVLKSSGHGEGWDGHTEGDDVNFWGQTCDKDSGGVHPSEPAERTARDKDAADKRRVFACIMAGFKDYAGDVMRSVPLNQALNVK